MNRIAQSLLLALLGGALLKISAFSADFANYVRPGFRPALVLAGAVLVALAVATLIHDRHRLVRAARQKQATRARRAEEAHLARLIGRQPAPAPSARGEVHEHADGGRVAWLLMVPVAVIFLVAPPALGSFAVRQAEREAHMPPPTLVDADPPRLRSGRVNVLSMGEFAGLAWDDAGQALRGKTVRLTGFVVPSAREREWYLTRMRIGCCAADALMMRVVVKGEPAPATDSWVRVTGTWIPRQKRGAYTPPELDASRVEPIAAPAEPYE